MSNTKSADQLRVQKMYRLDRATIEYVDEKAPNFARGARGGASRSLDAIVNFSREFETTSVEDLMQMVLGRANSGMCNDSEFKLKLEAFMKEQGLI